MDDVTLFQHLNGIENRIRQDVAEIRVDVKQAVVKSAEHEIRLDQVERRANWVDWIFGSAIAGTVVALMAHLKGLFGK